MILLEVILPRYADQWINNTFQCLIELGCNSPGDVKRETRTCAIKEVKLVLPNFPLWKIRQADQLLLNQEVTGYILSFKDSFVSLGAHEFDWSCQTSLFQLFSDCQVFSIQKEVAADIREIVIQILKEFEHEYSFKVQMLRRYFKIFLIYLVRQFEMAQQNSIHTREQELVKGFMELLEKNFKEKKMVSDYAAQLCITPNYLNGIVKKSTGFSAGYHIR